MASESNKRARIRDSARDFTLLIAPVRGLVSAEGGIKAIVAVLSKVQDRRMRGKVKYPLENVLAALIYISLKGELTSCCYAADFISVQRDELVRIGLWPDGIPAPSHDTIRNVLMGLDSGSLRKNVVDRLRRMMERASESSGAKGIRMVSADGQEANGSGRKGSARNANIMDYHDVSGGACLLSVPIGDKESEIKTLQGMLRAMNLRNTLVTADALHCQRETCSIITGKRGKFMFKVKDNQPGLVKDIDERMSRPGAKIVRGSAYGYDYEILFLKNPAGHDFEGTRAYVRAVSHKRDAHKGNSPTVHRLITSLGDVETILEGLDLMWEIEDGLHSFRDVQLGQDRVRLMDKRALESIATINNAVYALHRVATPLLGFDRMQLTRIKFKNDTSSTLALVGSLLKGKSFDALLKKAVEKKGA